jgi:hypothetical protein
MGQPLKPPTRGGCGFVLGKGAARRTAGMRRERYERETGCARGVVSCNCKQKNECEVKSADKEMRSRINLADAEAGIAEQQNGALRQQGRAGNKRMMTKQKVV